MKKRILTSALCAVLLLSALASCGGKQDNKTADTEAEKSTDTAAAETEDSLKSLLPTDLDFGGEEVRILNGFYFENDAFMLHVDEASGDVVDDAIYNRIINVESQLNVQFSYQDTYLPGGDDTAAILRRSVTAGSDDYDIVFGCQYNLVPLVLDNIMLNIEGAEYLHLDQPWWYQDYIDEMSIGEGKTYFVTGDITLGVLRNMSCMYVNKQLYTQNYESIDDMYNEVLDGKWTFDRLAEVCTEMYQDLNGNGTYDDDDRYGIGVITANLTDHFTYDAGIRATERDENNIPYLMMNNEKTVTHTQKLYSLYYENPGVRVFPPDYNSLDVVMPNKFNANELLYLPGWFYTSELLRNMNVDYAVIPFPKYDEAQESYLSLAHDISVITCLPTTCSKVDISTAAMEALAFEGYRSVLPAYYEVAVKVKYTRDSTDAAMQILDIIHDNSTTDFAFIYNYALNGLGLIERELMGGKKADFASYYAKKESGFQKKLDALIEVYTSLDT
ncbi:MAG: hypothetical protein ACI3XM_06365 [Eubacteriales bacterium]